MNEAKTVFNMATVRVIGAALEIIAAVLMLKFGTVGTALKINALLGLVGPAVLLVVSTLGVVSIACQVSVVKTAMVAAGVILIWVAAK